MMWSIETDDFKGLSGVKYPLLKSVNYVLSESSNMIPDTTEKPPSASASPIYPSALTLLLLSTAALFVLTTSQC